MRILLVAALSVLAACHKPEPVVESPPPSVEQERAERAEVPESMQRHWDFSQPDSAGRRVQQLHHRTMLTEENQLGVVLFSSVKPDQVPAVMDKVMSEMAREFPHEDVTLAVYTVATPPRKIGTAHLNGQSERTTYTPL